MVIIEYSKLDVTYIIQEEDSIVINSCTISFKLIIIFLVMFYIVKTIIVLD